MIAIAGAETNGDLQRRQGMRSIAELVEPDRVHRTVYTDQEIFDREIEQIFEKVWVYCGHESQVKAPGDYTLAGSQSRSAGAYDGRSLRRGDRSIAEGLFQSIRLRSREKGRRRRAGLER